MNSASNQYRLMYSVQPEVLLHRKEAGIMAHSTHAECMATIDGLMEQMRMCHLERTEGWGEINIPFGIPMRDFVGSKENAEEAALALSTIVDLKSRKRLLNVSTHIEGDEIGDRKSEREYYPTNDIILESSPA